MLTVLRYDLNPEMIEKLSSPTTMCHSGICVPEVHKAEDQIKLLKKPPPPVPAPGSQPPSDFTKRLPQSHDPRRPSGPLSRKWFGFPDFYKIFLLFSSI
ncbi:hypothetical protein J6590_013754 [Homalodisca vitripennis]|nr:hypothetical protein J6590_013754 [Homalodisca vitripennis]